MLRFHFKKCILKIIKNPFQVGVLWHASYTTLVLSFTNKQVWTEQKQFQNILYRTKKKNPNKKNCYDCPKKQFSKKKTCLKKNQFFQNKGISYIFTKMLISLQNFQYFRWKKKLVCSIEIIMNIEIIKIIVKS